MPTNPRVAKAFRAMRDLGIAEDKVKPVLKNLLKLYEKNWDYIEAENYRVLADAIFDNEEAMVNQAAQSKKKLESSQEPVTEEEAQEQGEPARPLKRLRLKYQGQASESCNNSNRLAGTSLIIPKDEPVELPEVHPQRQLRSMVGSTPTHNGHRSIESQHLSRELLDRSKGKQPVSPKSLTIQERTRTSHHVIANESETNIPMTVGSGTIPHQMSLRNGRMGALSPQPASVDKRLESERLSHKVSKEKTVGVQSLVQPKEEPFTCDTPVFDLPLAVIHPETSNRGDSLRENSSIEEPHDGSEPPLILEHPGGKSVSDGIPSLSSETRVNSQLSTVADGSSSQLQVASSPLGEVKISLSCKISPERPDFHMPSLDAVVKLVEDRCLRSYKFLDPNFSVMKLMKDMCDCFLELGTESCSESEGNMQVSPRNDVLESFPSGDPLVGEGLHFHMPDGLYNAQSETEVVFPKTLQLSTPCTGIHDCAQPHQEASQCNRIHEDTEQNDLDDPNCRSLVVCQQHELTPDQIRYLHDVIDISKGQERVVISLVNEINSECPPSFHYIPQNAVFQNAYMNFSLARIGDNNCCSTCCGDCLSLSTPCACAHETGGEFVYTAEGLVKEEFLNECVSMNRKPEKHCQYFCKECPLERSKNEDVIEPCKGHLVRKFIKECWWKCGCSKQCGNRVVQRGITRNLQVFMSEGKGWGLRTLEDLPKGAFVCEYVGEVLTNAELFDRVSRNPKGEVHSYPVLLDADWVCEGVLKDEEALCLDATHYGNVARFINHRCFDSNMVEIPVEVETPDHHYYHLAFFTTKKVKAMEELTWDYGIDFDDVDHPVKAFHCQCGSKYCRNIRRPSRSRSSLRR
ncbi:probable inactive histone-lysine N-methyltransferase SUVR2 isoform X1 [Coffea arabica]